jgi:hypothetical protein
MLSSRFDFLSFFRDVRRFTLGFPDRSFPNGVRELNSITRVFSPESDRPNFLSRSPSIAQKRSASAPVSPGTASV